MSSDATDPRLDEENESAEDEVDRSCTARKKQKKAPKRILKAEREKLKREQLNDLFSSLAGALELDEENNGKACILREAIKLVNDLFSQMQGLKKENATLLSESQYLTTEKNELKDENTALEALIKDIQNEIDARVLQSKPDLNSIPPECWQTGTMSNLPEVSPSVHSLDPTLHQPPFLGSVYVLPAGPGLQGYPKHATVADPPSIVKPHARYPSSSDSWTLQLLQK